MAELHVSARERLKALAGGRRGMVEGGLPPIAFIATNTLAAGPLGSDRGLVLAIIVAFTAGAALAAVALAHGRPTRQALAGLGAVAVAAGFAAWAGNARAYFLPGIWVDALYAAALTGSVMLGRPAVGYVHGWLLGRAEPWWHDRQARRTFSAVTLGWAGIYALRAGIQTALYTGQQPELLGLAKIGLGWPLTAVGLAGTVAYLRRRHLITAPGG